LEPQSRNHDHLLVDGTLIVRDGDLVPDALPGRPLRAVPA
jgi:hypothetical protein